MRRKQIDNSLQKKKLPKDKQQLTKHNITKIKPEQHKPHYKTGVDLRCSDKVWRSISTNVTLCVVMKVSTPMISLFQGVTFEDRRTG